MSGTSINRGILARVGAAASGFVAATVAEILVGISNVISVTPMGLRQMMIAQTLTDATTVLWDMNKGYRAKLQLTANGHKIANPTNLAEGLSGSLTIDPNAFTIAASSSGWDTGWDFGAAGYPTIPTTAGKKQVVFYECLDAVTPVLRAVFSQAA